MAKVFAYYLYCLTPMVLKKFNFTAFNHTVNFFP